MFNSNEDIWKSTPFGESSIFHPNYDKSQEEKRQLQANKDKPLTGNISYIKNNCTCKLYTKAKNFNDLISLVKDAEEIMIKNNLTDLGDRINCLRGIYYGADYSLDYQQEKSSARNKGFRVYTTFKIENDARAMLKCGDDCKGNLFQALYESPEVIESSSRIVDFGHLMIGLDARRSYIAKHSNFPFGGSGLENVTWIGDIGGGAGMLALKRVTDPNIRAKKLVFDSLHDYGCSINIEGDIAGYVVGRNEIKWKIISNPLDNMEYIYEGLKKYFDKGYWTGRANCFIAMIGGEFENGELTNREDLLDEIIDSVEGFAQLYIVIRSKDKSYDKLTLLKSFGYIKSCAKEVAEIFLDGLLDLRMHPNSTKYRAVTDPNPTRIDNSEIIDAIKSAQSIIDKIQKLL